MPGVSKGRRVSWGGKGFEGRRSNPGRDLRDIPIQPLNLPAECQGGNAGAVSVSPPLTSLHLSIMDHKDSCQTVVWTEHVLLEPRSDTPTLESFQPARPLTPWWPGAHTGDLGLPVRSSGKDNGSVEDLASHPGPAGSQLGGLTQATYPHWGLSTLMGNCSAFFQGL